MTFAFIEIHSRDLLSFNLLNILYNSIHLIIYLFVFIQFTFAIFRLIKTIIWNTGSRIMTGGVNGKYISDLGPDCSEPGQREENSQWAK